MVMATVTVMARRRRRDARERVFFVTSVFFI
jgi:hypothetical protein